METHRFSLPRLCNERGHLKPVVCLELNPPRDGNWGALAAVVNRCARYKPDFLTMTDTGQARGADAISTAIELQRLFGLPVIAHLTCVDRSRDKFLRDASALVEGGIRHVLVLRGDPVRGTTFTPHPEGFSHAHEALEALRDRTFPFTMGAACYPQGHPDDKRQWQDLENMARKAASGATFFVTQAGFESSLDDYRLHSLAATKAGALGPILTCHLAIESVDRLQRVGRRCGVNVPNELIASLARRGDRHVIREMAGFARSNWVQGAPGIVVSTFNDPDATERFLEHLFEQHVARRRDP